MFALMIQLIYNYNYLLGNEGIDLKSDMVK